MTTPVDPRAIEDLVARVDAALPSTRGRIVAFVASGAGEGTSTVAAAYAAAHSAHLRRRVLLLTTGDSGTARQGVLQALADGKALDDVVTPTRDGGFTAPLGGVGDGGPAWDLLAREDVWQTLRDRFDLVVLDMPAASASGAALRVAPLADGVVVVLEAEKTRAPVVDHLIASLSAVRAHVLGTVLNKRRFYLPSRLYRWL